MLGTMNQLIQRGDIEDFINEFSNQIPLQDGSVPGQRNVTAMFAPSEAAANQDLSRAVAMARHGDLDSARSIASIYGYAIIEYHDLGQARGRDYLILCETMQSSGACRRNWGLFIFAVRNKSGSSFGTPVSIQVPHPLFDMNTPQLGIRSFVETKADSFFIAGIHRYRTEESRTEAAWSRPESSDMAHNEHSLFRYLADTCTQPDKFHQFVGLQPYKIVQIHGFGISDNTAGGGQWRYNAKSSYPQIVLSNGDESLQGRRIALLDRLSRELWKRVGTQPQRMTTGIYNGWEFSDLGATANVVGATVRARGDGSQFIHIEADPSIRVTSTWLEGKGLDAEAERAWKYQRFGRALWLVLVAENGQLQQKL